MRQIAQLRIGALVATFLLGTIATLGQDSNAIFEFDPGFGLNLELNKKFRLEFSTGSEKTEELASYKWKFTGGISLRVKPIRKRFSEAPDDDKRHMLVVGAFYEYSRSSEAGAESNEHRIMIDATPRNLFPSKFLLSDRSRLEFRWVEGQYRFRYRNRLKLEREISLGKLRLTPYGSAEAYWDKHYERWSKFKFAAGTEIPIRKRMSFDVFYEREHCVVCSDSQRNILGLSLNMFFKLKKT